MIEPTQKQLDLIEKIEEACDADFEQWCSEHGRLPAIDAASDFIDEYIDEYRRQRGR